MDDEEYLQPILTSHEEHFQKLDTVSIVSFPLIFSVSVIFFEYIEDCIEVFHADIVCLFRCL